MDTVAQLNSVLSGRYDVEREIGAGGMATVYLARDIKHNRKVAVKVLRPDLGAVLGVERFLSEIQVTANLQHPNLLPLFDSGEADGLLFYVMPFVEGESLRARIEREKQLPVDEAIHIATSVASALDYAHRHGVIHRDLKPENILMHEEQPLVADFGIALAVSNAGGGRITQTGLSLGTPKYMSPEQATGDRVIDARSDIYSLGAVTYELLTGDPPHEGSTSQAIIARVLTERPRAIRSTRPNVPEHVEAAVEHALEKLPADRFASAREFADALNGKFMMTSRATAAMTSGRTAKRGPYDRFRRFERPILLAIAILALAGAGYLWKSASRGDARTTVRFVLNLLPDERWNYAGTGTPFALSPDGKILVYAASRANSIGRLYVRPLNDLTARELAGTEGAAQPFFSPDGKWIAFYANSQLKKVQVDGGTPLMLANVPGMLGGSWGTSDQIIVSSEGRIGAVPATGGTLHTIASPDSSRGEVLMRWPLALSDGKSVLYTSFSATGLNGARIGVVSLASGKARVLDLPGTDPQAILDGYLVYASAAGAIMAVPFDLRSTKYSGTPVPVIDGVLVGGAGSLKGNVSASGSIVHVSGSATNRVVIAGDGAERVLIPNEAEYAHPRFSPDGKRIAFSIGGPNSRDVWVYEIASGTMQKLTNEGKVNERPEWTPDGKRVLYRSDRDSTSAIWWQPADMSAAATILFADKRGEAWEALFSPDARSMLVRLDQGSGHFEEDIYMRSVSGDTTLKPFIVGKFNDLSPRFSPDGKWVAYTSDQSGTTEVYVTPFPGPGARNLVSTSGGVSPLWYPDGRRIAYVSGQQVIEATLTFTPAFSVTSRRTVYDGQFSSSSTHANYDITPDGKLLMLKSSVDNSRVIVVHDWKYELRARMGAGKN
jgi:Tol biopolymer transport system component